MKKLLVLSLVLLLGMTCMAKTNYFDSIVVAGALTMSGTSATSFTGTTFAVDMSSTVVIDGATSVRNVSAGFTSLEAAANRIGVNATIYMSIATTAASGITTITHTGTAPAVTWTADSLSFVGSFDTNGATVSLDGSTSTRAISAGFTSSESPANRLGLNATEYIQIATAVTTGITTITHTGNAPTVTWTANSFDFVGAFAADALTLSDVLTFSDAGTIDNTAADTLTLTETNVAVVGEFGVTGGIAVDGTTVLLDGSTSVRAISAGFASIEGPATRIGPNATTYMNIAVAATTGNTAITHVAGSADAVTWTAAGGFDFVGAMALDATTLSDVLTFSDAATIDNTAADTLTITETNIDLVGAVDVSSFFDMGTMDVGIPVTTADPFAMEVHTEPLTTLTAGDTGLTAGIRSRYQVSVAQPNQISVSAVEARLRVKHALADGVHSAVSGVIEASGTDSDFTGTATTQRSAGFFALDFDADVTLANDGWLTGVTINSSVDGAVSMAATKFAGLRISTNSGKEAWEQGIVIDDSAAVIGVDIGTCTTDIVGQNEESLDNATDGFWNAQAGLTSYAQSVVLNDRHRVTVAEINAGHELLPAITGRAYRIVSVTAIAYGGAVGTTTTVDILGTQAAGSVKIAAFAQASLTQSAVLNAGDAGAAVLADGASFAACDAATAITIGKTGGNLDTATGVDIIITYVIE